VLIDVWLLCQTRPGLVGGSGLAEQNKVSKRLNGNKLKPELAKILETPSATSEKTPAFNKKAASEKRHRERKIREKKAKNQKLERRIKGRRLTTNQKSSGAKIVHEKGKGVREKERGIGAPREHQWQTRGANTKGVKRARRSGYSKKVARHVPRRLQEKPRGQRRRKRGKKGQQRHGCRCGGPFPTNKQQKKTGGIENSKKTKKEPDKQRGLAGRRKEIL